MIRRNGAKWDPMCACVRLRPVVSVLLSSVIAILLTARESAAHAKLQTASPPANSQLDQSPSEIKLSFTEPIEVRLSKITVRSAKQSQAPSVSSVPGDRRSCIAGLTPLKAGAYVVDWQVVSSDGHATSGSYSFTIREHETQAPAVTQPEEPMGLPPPPPPDPSRREMAARWLFIAGVALLLGAAVASAASFGGDGDITVAATGWAIAAVGIVLLGDAQRRAAAASYDELMQTTIGHALIWRGAALAAAAAALIAARAGAPRLGAMMLVATSALASIAVHSAAGHAAAVERYSFAAIGLQSVHFAAAGVWFGGLAALLAGTRGHPDAAKTTAVRRYSSLAGVALATVGVTGVLRTVQELSSWRQLASTDYGEAALAKGVLLVAIAAFGALNRWRSVPAAPTDLRPLRRVALIELGLMTVALAVAAILATLAPPE